MTEFYEGGLAWHCLILPSRVVGVFDTVGSVGMPEELSLSNEKLKNIFGFPDKRLGHHIERAYQALAVNETRADFVSELSILNTCMHCF